MEINQLSKFVFEELDKMSIENIVVLDVKEKTSLSDYVIIGTGRGERHIEATIEKLRTTLKQKNFNIPFIEGKNTDWLLIDLQSIIVHLFTEESREKYSLEKLWNN